MEKVLLLMGLGISSVQDLRWKKVWLPLLWGITIVLLAKKYFEHPRDFSWMLCCLFFLLFFLAMHRLTNRQIGVGDAFLFGMTGAGLGWKDNVMLIYVTFFLVFLAALFLLVIKKKGREHEIPLCPFVFLAFLLIQ